MNAQGKVPASQLPARDADLHFLALRMTLVERLTAKTKIPLLIEDLGGVVDEPRLPLLGGGYYLNVGTIDSRSALLVYDVQERLCPFRVRNPSDEFGLMRMDHAWLASDASPLRAAE